jgi:predicted O-methyltransferase YrrM
MIGARAGGGAGEVEDRAETEGLAAAAGVEGWLTQAQARRLWDRARAVGPAGTIVESGSFRGRSSVVLARAAGEGVAVIAIDPHAGTDRGPNQIRGFEREAEADHEVFHTNLERAGVGDRVRHVRAFSHDALGEVDGQIDLLYIDGAHRYGPATADMRVWGARVGVGGVMLIHDTFSSVGVTLAIVRVLVFGPRFRYVGRTGSLAEYRREAVEGLPRMGNGLRQLAQLPWFARNVAVKVLFAARLRPLARLLGHRSETVPY